MAGWKRFIVELYDQAGYRGCWEPEATTQRRYDEADLARFVKEVVRGILKLDRAELRFAEDGPDLIVAAFLDVEPPKIPKRGTSYVPGFDVDP